MICNLITPSNILTYNKQEETIQTKTKRKNSRKKKENDVINVIKNYH